MSWSRHSAWRGEAHVHTAAPYPSLQTTTLLPNPQFSDQEGLTATVTRKTAMDGTRYTYVKRKGDRRKLKWSFRLTRNKGLELRAFIFAYFASQVKIIDHNGRVWVGNFTNNPFEFDTAGAGRAGNQPDAARRDADDRTGVRGGRAMRNISAAGLAKLAERHGNEPITIIEVDWVDGRTSSYADRTVGTIPGRIVEVGELDNVINVSSNSGSQELSVTLDDTDGTIKAIFDSHDVHKRTARVYQYFEGLDLCDKFLLFSGKVKLPIIWNERDRTINFTILSQLEDKEIGFSGGRRPVPLSAFRHGGQSLAHDLRQGDELPRPASQ